MAITVKSDFWGANFSFIQDRSNFIKIIARELNLRQNRRTRALINALTGVAPGATATATLKRVAADRLENGGKRTIETETLVNRATVAADVTEITSKLGTYRSQPTTYPVDKATRP